MRTTPPLLKIAMALGLLTGMTWLMCPVSASAQFVLGSWQDSSDDGWIRVSSGGTSLGSIYASSNDPSAFQQVSNVVSGYPYSLDVEETGYGTVRAQVNITSLTGGLAAWLSNSNLNFTFSCGPDTGAGSGYMQMVGFQYNANTAGFNNITANWATNGFSETGSTGNDSAGQPVYDFYAGATPRSQVVTWNYSSVKSAVGTNPSYLQITFVFQTGGGAPTNIYLNNVNLSGAPVVTAVTTTNLVIDDFASTGVSPSNPTNDDYYSSAQSYSAGQITNVWGKWFGNAVTNVSWDSTMDASNTAGSGSMKLSLDWSQDTQFVVWDQGAVNDYYQINANCATTFTNFQCDVKFAPGSASSVGNGTGPGGTTTGVFGHLRFGNRTSAYGQDWFGSVDVLATNSGWVHVSVPLNVAVNTSLTNLNGLIIGIDDTYYNLNLTNASTLWVDNLKLVGPIASAVVVAPKLSIQSAKPGLRIFAGSTVNTYDREELATVDSSQSWIGATYPVSYSFKLLDSNTNISQTQIFLIPVSNSGQSNMGNNGTVNEYIDYQASNGLWMIINPAGTNVVATVEWKTNLANANPNNMALIITNPTAVGTWSLTFNSATTGSLTAPGAAAAPFTIADANITADFGNPLIAYFGIQPNTLGGIGQYEDYGSISVVNVSGVQENENFTTESTFNANGYFANNSAQTTSIELASVGTPFWVYWPATAFNYGLGEAASVLGNTNTEGYPYVLPEYYNSYNDGLTVPGTGSEGTNTWVLLPTNCLPTIDGSQGTGLLAPKGFFRLFNPPLEN